MKQLKFQSTIYCKLNNQPVVYKSNELIIDLIEESPVTRYNPVIIDVYCPKRCNAVCTCNLPLIRLLSFSAICRL